MIDLTGDYSLPANTHEERILINVRAHVHVVKPVGPVLEQVR